MSENDYSVCPHALFCTSQALISSLRDRAAYFAVAPAALRRHYSRIGDPGSSELLQYSFAFPCWMYGGSLLCVVRRVEVPIDRQQVTY